MLTILYSGCNAELDGVATRPGRPQWFNKINCFLNLKKTIDLCKYPVELVMVMDSPEENILSAKAKEFGYKVFFNDFKSAARSYSFKLDYAKTLTDSDYIYFLEDDYVHTPNALNILYEGVSKFGLITGYDHLDRYTRNDDVCLGNEYIFFHEGVHWRTCESTTTTFMCTKDMFGKILPYAQKHLGNDRNFFRELYFMGIRLLTPMPGVSTHIHEAFLSPGVDWEKTLKESIS